MVVVIMGLLQRVVLLVLVLVLQEIAAAGQQLRPLLEVPLMIRLCSRYLGLYDGMVM